MLKKKRRTLKPLIFDIRAPASALEVRGQWRSQTKVLPGAM